MNLEKIIKALKYFPVVIILFFGKVKNGKKETSEKDSSSDNNDQHNFQ